MILRFFSFISYRLPHQNQRSFTYTKKKVKKKMRNYFCFIFLKDKNESFILFCRYCWQCLNKQQNIYKLKIILYYCYCYCLFLIKDERLSFQFLLLFYPKNIFHCRCCGERVKIFRKLISAVVFKLKKFFWFIFMKIMERPPFIHYFPFFSIIFTQIKPFFWSFN